MENPRREPKFLLKCLSAGLASSMADIATHPLETLKIRLQVQGERLAYTPKVIQSKPSSTASISRSSINSVSLSNSARDGDASHTRPTSLHKGVARLCYAIIINEGPLVLYNGLNMSIQRQMVYASVRIGCYDSVKLFYMDILQGGDNAHISPFNVGLRILAAVTTCCIAVAVTQPMDLVKLRMQAMPTGGQIKHRYSGSINAYRTIITGEGIIGLWKGTLPNMARNSVVSACELVTYDVIKEQIIRLKLLSDNLGCHFVSALSSGFVCAVVSNPIDVIKTRIMNAEKGVYRGVGNCAQVLLRDEGFGAFYKGFLPFYLRVGSWNIVMFICYEQVKRFFASYS